MFCVRSWFPSLHRKWKEYTESSEDMEQIKKKMAGLKTERDQALEDKDEAIAAKKEAEAKVEEVRVCV